MLANLIKQWKAKDWHQQLPSDLYTYTMACALVYIHEYTNMYIKLNYFVLWIFVCLMYVLFCVFINISVILDLRTDWQYVWYINIKTTRRGSTYL